MMGVAAHEFICKFLLNVLPENFKLKLQAILSNLSNSGLFEDSYKIALEADRRSPNDPSIISQLLLATGRLEMDDEFEKYAKQWVKITGEEHPLTTFPEDDDENLSRMIEMTDISINCDPGLLVEPDPELMKLAEELVKGVEV